VGFVCDAISDIALDAMEIVDYSIVFFAGFTGTFIAI